MRFQTIKSFRKHLEEASPHHFSKIYVLLGLDPFEAKYMAEEIGAKMGRKVERSLASWQSPSLFDEPLLFFLEDVEKKISLPDSPVVLSGKKKGLIAYEKEGVILDLSEEKSWEKEKRLAEEAFFIAAKHGKKIFASEASLLVERSGMSLPLLRSEVEMAAVAAGMREVISRADIEAMPSLTQEPTLWKIAEAMVFEGRFSQVAEGDFFPFLPQLREQVRQALILSEGVERGEQDFAPLLPKVYPKALEKKRGAVMGKPSSLYRERLNALFDLEIEAKGAQKDYLALLILWYHPLHASFAQSPR